MKKTFRSIITLLLVVTMLVGVMSTAVLAAPAYGNVSDGSKPAEGDFSNGWCDITCDENGITVTLGSDVSAILGTNASELKAMLTTVIDGIQKLVLDDLKENLVGSMSPEYGEGEVDFEGVCQLAIDTYVDDLYGTSDFSGYLAFLEDLLDENNVDSKGNNLAFVGFADYLCQMLDSAVRLNNIDPETLPGRVAIENAVISLFEDRFNAIVDETVSEFIGEYVKLLKGESADINSDVKAVIDDYVSAYVQVKFDNYINGLKGLPVDADEVDAILSVYFDDEIIDQLDAWLTAYVNGTDEIPASVKEMIDAEVGIWIDEVISAYADKVYPTDPSPIYNMAMNALKGDVLANENAVMRSYIEKYLNGDSSLSAAIKDDIAGILKNEAPAQIYTLLVGYWRENSDVLKNNTFWASIFAEVKAYAVSKIVANSGGTLDNDSAAAVFDSQTYEDLWIEFGMDEFDNELKATIKSAVADYSNEDWKTAWEQLASEQFRIIAIVKSSAAYSKIVRNVIDEYYWSGSNAEANRKNAVASIIEPGSEEYYDILVGIADYAKTEHVSIIEDKVAEYIGNGGEKLIASISEIIQSASPEDLAKFEEAIYAKANESTSDIIEEYFGISDEAIIALVKSTYAPMLLNKYEAKVAELKASGVVEPTAEELIAMILGHIQSVSVADRVVFAGKKFDVNAIKELVFELLPTFEEIAVMDYSDMKLTFDIDIKTDFGTSDFSLNLVLAPSERAYNAIIKVARIAAYYLDFDMNDDGVIVFNLVVPDEFADVVLRLAESDRVPDRLKKEVFAAFTTTPDDVYARFNNVTLDTFLRLFDYVDFEGMLDHRFVSRFEKLDGLTEEQVKNKIKEYEGYYNKLVNIVKKVYNKIPAGLTEKTILDFYGGDGSFAHSGSYSVDVESLISKFSPKYAAIIASFMTSPVIDASIDFAVQFEEINKVNFVVEGVDFGEGLLPKGANLAYFSQVSRYEGYPIVAWADENGKIYTTMPDKDITLYAVIDRIGDAVVNVQSEIVKVYDGNEEKILAAIDFGSFTDEAYAVFEWYKNGELIDGATGSEISVTDVADSGEYYCKVVIYDGGVPYGPITSNVCTVAISKADIDLSTDYHWGPASYVYNGQEQYVYLLDAQGTPLLSGHGITYVSNAEYQNYATDVGTYTAKVVFESANYNIIGYAETFEWTITRATYDMSGISFNDATVIYNGEKQNLAITGTLPEGVTVTYTPKDFIEAGVYEVTAQFTGNPNYNTIPDMKATLTILGFNKNHSHVDADGTKLLEIFAANGVLETYSLNMRDLTTQYNYFESTAVFGEGKVGYVAGVYDIKFVLDGVTQNVSDQFTVKLLIPASARALTDDLLKVVYVPENGEVVDMNAVRDGDYLIFSTTHFSVYSIVTVGDAPVVPVEKDLTWLWVLIIVLSVLLVVAVIIIIIIKKRKGGKGNGGNDVAPVEPTDEPEPEKEVLEPAGEELPAQKPELMPIVTKPIIRESELDVKPVEGEVLHIRYRTSFLSRLIQAEPPIQDYYTEIKNALLSYKGVKARTSWNFESFNKGRIQCAKLNVKGSTFQLYLGLGCEDYNANKYHFTNVGDKPKLDKVPMLLKIKSERGLKYALELIEEMMAKFEIPKIQRKPLDYHMPYESTESLAARELVKIILPSGATLDADKNFVKLDVRNLIDNANTEKTEEAAAAEEATPVVENSAPEASETEAAE